MIPNPIPLSVTFSLPCTVLLSRHDSMAGGGSPSAQGGGGGSLRSRADEEADGKSLVLLSPLRPRSVRPPQRSAPLSRRRLPLSKPPPAFTHLDAGVAGTIVVRMDGLLLISYAMVERSRGGIAGLHHQGHIAGGQGTLGGMQ